MSEMSIEEFLWRQENCGFQDSFKARSRQREIEARISFWRNNKDYQYADSRGSTV